MGIVVDRPEAERFADESDRAAAIDAQIQAGAIEAHRVRQALADARHRQGTCSNCGATCLPLAVYCDKDCREDDEKRLAAHRRTGAVGLAGDR